MKSDTSNTHESNEIKKDITVKDTQEKNKNPVDENGKEILATGRVGDLDIGDKIFS